MPEPRRVAATDVRTGDILRTTGRVIVQVRVENHHVILSHGPRHYVAVFADDPVWVIRPSREEHIRDDVDTADRGHTWYVEARRPY